MTMTRKWASEAERSRSRRAYQRAWRNKRNYERLTAEIGDLNAKRAQSFRLWQYAESELWVTR